MRARILQLFIYSSILAGIFFPLNGLAQQWVIANKDNTRPEITRDQFIPAQITTLSVVRFDDFNRIEWSTRGEEETRRFIVEYSGDGTNFETAGEVIAANTPYKLNHVSKGGDPLYYRVRIESPDGRYSYSRTIFLDGNTALPVKLYSTTITGNVIKADAQIPVERVAVFSGSGQKVFAQDVGGKMDYMAFTVPSLSKGMYWVSFFGEDWKITRQFIVP